MSVMQGDDCRPEIEKRGMEEMGGCGLPVPGSGRPSTALKPQC